MSNLNLKNFWQSFKKDRLLLIALFLGLLLRGSNPTFGSPSLYVSNDEAITHLSALNMMANSTIESIANYTPFSAYIQIPIIGAVFLIMKILGYTESIFGFELFLLTHEGYFLFIPRIISAGFGTLLVMIVYKTSLLLFNDKKTAIIATFLASFSFNLVHISISGRPWAAALFFMTLSVYFALKDKGGRALFACAIGFGFHQVSILALPLILFKNLLPSTEKSSNFLAQNKRRIWYFVKLLGFAIAILILNSLTLKSGFIDAISQNQSFLYSDRLITDLLVGNKNLIESTLRTIYLNLSVFYIKNFAVTDIVILVFGIIGMQRAFRKKPLSRILILYILSYFIFASLFFHPLIRYLLPIMILIIFFAAYSLSFVSSKVILIVIIMASGINSFWFAYLYLKEPTFVSVHKWVSQNIQSSVPISYTGGRFYYFVPDYNSLTYMQKYSKNSGVRLGTIRSYSGENVRNVIFLIKIPGKSKLEQLKRVNREYGAYIVVDYYLDPKNSIFSQSPETFTLVKRFSPARSEKIVGIAEMLFDSSSNFDTFTARKNGSMYELTRAGPYFDVLKIKDFQLE